MARPTQRTDKADSLLLTVFGQTERRRLIDVSVAHERAPAVRWRLSATVQEIGMVQYVFSDKTGTLTQVPRRAWLTAVCRRYATV